MCVCTSHYLLFLQFVLFYLIKTYPFNLFVFISVFMRFWMSQVVLLRSGSVGVVHRAANAYIQRVRFDITPWLLFLKKKLRRITLYTFTVARLACLVSVQWAPFKGARRPYGRLRFHIIESSRGKSAQKKKAFQKKNVALRPTINSRCFGTLPDFGVRVSLRLKEADKIKRCFICTRRGALRARWEIF